MIGKTKTSLVFMGALFRLGRLSSESQNPDIIAASVYLNDYFIFSDFDVLIADVVRAVAPFYNEITHPDTTKLSPPLLARLQRSGPPLSYLCLLDLWPDLSSTQHHEAFEDLRSLVVSSYLLLAAREFHFACLINRAELFASCFRCGVSAENVVDQVLGLASKMEPRFLIAPGVKQFLLKHSDLPNRQPEVLPELVG